MLVHTSKNDKSRLVDRKAAVLYIVQLSNRENLKTVID